MLDKFPGQNQKKLKPLNKKTSPIEKNNWYRKKLEGGKGNGRQKAKYRKHSEDAYEKMAVEEKFESINFEAEKIKKLTRLIVEKFLDRKTYFQTKIGLGEWSAKDGNNRKDIVDYVNESIKYKMNKEFIDQIMEYFQKLDLQDRVKKVFPQMDFENFEGKSFNTIHLDHEYKGAEGLIKLKQEILSFFESEKNKSSN